jgi:hypothetical protein
MQSKWLSGLLVIACVALLSGVGFASACSDTTFDQYLGAGFNCTIGDKTFSNFAYHGTSNPPGFSIPAGGIDVTPITTPLNPGFQWSAGWHVSTSSGVLSQDSLFQFTVNSSSANITDVSLSIGGAGFSGTGSVTVDETVCLGATFPACSGGTVKTLEVFDSIDGVKTFDEVSFAGVSEVDVQKDVLIDAGTAGSASLSLLTNQFSEQGTTPEPASILLFGSGALALAGVLRRKIKH